MKRVLLAVALALILSGCSNGCTDVMAPDQSSAITNRGILEQTTRTNELLERNNKLLDSLITITAQKGK